MDDPRFSKYGVLPPKSKADYAFLLHGFYHLKHSGAMAIVLPHGILFRGAAEGKIRQKLLEEGAIDAVIGLPANLFYGAGIPACILIFRKDRGTNEKVLFIDASGDGHYEKGKNQNILRDEDVQKIVDTYRAYKTDINYKDEEKFSHVATLQEIAENDYNLNIPRYVDTFEEEELIDIDEVKQNIANIEAELAEVQAQMKKYMEELGL